MHTYPCAPWTLSEMDIDLRLSGRRSYIANIVIIETLKGSDFHFSFHPMRSVIPRFIVEKEQSTNCLSDDNLLGINL